MPETTETEASRMLNLRTAVESLPGFEGANIDYHTKDSDGDEIQVILIVRADAYDA